LIFGNLSAQETSTRGLGINKSEFILGNLVDNCYGYGFGKNEIIKKIRSEIDKVDCGCIDLGNINLFTTERYQQEAYENQYKNICRVLKNIKRFHNKESIHKGDLKHPLAFRKLINISGDTEHVGLKLGYYFWRNPWQDEKGKKRYIRYIVLDTRSNWKPKFYSFQSEGVMDLFQLGWLYAQLEKALKQKECVVIFAHHSPFAMREDAHYSTRIFKRMLLKFPNIIAYFYGHEHPENIKWLDDKKFFFPLIKTGSLIDYPQVGRMVEIYIRPSTREEIDKQPTRIELAGWNCTHEAIVRWTFVRPKGTDNAHNAWLVESILENSLYLAEKDEKDDKVVDEWKKTSGEGQTEPVYLDLSGFNEAPAKKGIFRDFHNQKRINDTIDGLRKLIQ
jgi:hypothetical protein